MSRRTQPNGKPENAIPVYFVVIFINTLPTSPFVFWQMYWDTMPITSTMSMGVGDVVGKFTLPNDYVSKAEKGKVDDKMKRRKRKN